MHAFVLQHVRCIEEWRRATRLGRVHLLECGMRSLMAVPLPPPSAPHHFFIPLVSCCSYGDALPCDWFALAVEQGMRSFLAVPLGPSSAPMGILGVASPSESAFDHSR